MYPLSRRALAAAQFRPLASRRSHWAGPGFADGSRLGERASTASLVGPACSLPRRAPPPLGYFAETSRAAKRGHRLRTSDLALFRRLLAPRPLSASSGDAFPAYATGDRLG
jgi:hypothetical protein